MSIKNIALIILSVSIFFVVGCYSAPKQPATSDTAWNGGIVAASYGIVNTLENNLKQPISQNDTVVVASFVDISDLTKSSAFGRIMAEQVGSRLAQKGYKVIEMKLRQDSIFVDTENKGEFLLSRNIKDISQAHNAGVVVVGTYAKGFEKVYVSARMINPTDSIVMSSCDKSVEFENRYEMRRLMQ